MSLLTRIKEQALDRHMTLKEVAEKAGLNEKSMYAWDRSSPKSSNLASVAKVLNVSTDYLLNTLPEIAILTFKTDIQTDFYEPDYPELGGENYYYSVKVTRKTAFLNPEQITKLEDDDSIYIDIMSDVERNEFSHYTRMLSINISNKDMNNMSDESVYKHYESNQISIINEVRIKINELLTKRLYKVHHVDLWKLVNNSNRDNYADANGHILSVKDWDVFYQLLSKYGKMKSTAKTRKAINANLFARTLNELAQRDDDIDEDEVINITYKNELELVYYLNLVQENLSTIKRDKVTDAISALKDVLNNDATTVSAELSAYLKKVRDYD